MNLDQLSDAIAEAKRFLAVAQKCRSDLAERTKRKEYLIGGKVYAATKRASLDLSMALAALRRPNT